jgi:hypothetical protein
MAERIGIAIGLLGDRQLPRFLEHQREGEPLGADPAALNRVSAARHPPMSLQTSVRPNAK